MAYPFPATEGRTTERLSAYLSHYVEKKPVDLYFEDYPLIARFMSKKRTVSGSAQLVFPINTGESPNGQWVTDGYEQIALDNTNTARTLQYRWVAKFDAWAISELEMLEIKGSEHMIFDRVKLKRDNIMGGVLKDLNEDLMATSQVANKVTALALVCDNAGTVGNLSATTESTWAANETAHSAAYTAGGYDAILLKCQQIKQHKGRCSVIIVPFDIERDIEAQMDADIRYSSATGALARGASGLSIKGADVIADSDVTADTIFMLDERFIHYYEDSAMSMRFDKVEKIQDQHCFKSLFANKCQVVMTKRDAMGKLTSVT